MHLFFGALASALVLAMPGLASGSPSAPVNTALPAISGTAVAGSTLTTDNGTWSGQVQKYSYQWLRCNTDGASCGSISGATAKSYTLGSADVGSTMRVVVTVGNSKGSSSATSNPTAVVGSAAPPPPPPPPPSSGFVQRNGTSLVLNGSPYRFTGINDYGANQTCGPQIDLGSALTAWGGGSTDPNVVRAWFFQNMATTNGARDWSRFDNVLSTAASHGYRVIVTLANQWSDCDQGYGYKTAGWYQSGYTSNDPSGTQSYRDYIRDVITRYKDKTTILMWQLMNEAEANTSSGGSCPSNAESILQAWATDVSGLIKSIDPNHLVSIGTMGSGQCGAAGSEYQTLHSIPTVDVCEYHDYGSPSTAMPGDQWNGLHAKMDMCAADGKPIFVGESGISSSQDGGNLQTRANWFSSKFSAQFSAGVVGELVWGWETSDGYGFWPGDPTLGVLANY
jgi:mannan endo-1,4-beta-mannosidase